MKVCIPSKNRTSTIKTHLLFEPKDVLIFVEPQEIKKYKIFWPEYVFIDIKKNNQGLPYVRNFILNFVNEDKILMADDDINRLGIRNKDGRYDTLTFNVKEFLNEADKKLDTYWGYGIPTDSFAFFTNKNSNQQRLFINNRHMFGLHGLNIKKLKENNVQYDPNPMFFSAEDVDITAQILLNGGEVCIDYKYALNHDVRTPGGLSDMRKQTHFSLDLSVESGIEMLSKKYGFEFVKSIKDKEGYYKSFRLDYDLLLKNKEKVKKNCKEYLSKLKNSII